MQNGWGESHIRTVMDRTVFGVAVGHGAAYTKGNCYKLVALI
jgi:hypothetical protein